ncbi:hypothetical protein BASA60_001634 [Batrachochytrium salamandrivorans]|nr:hypothetical protein BASA60_001634 [Batrachochytrium salamandrivorans]
MHLVSDAHGYPMFAKACWESIKAAYTSVSITDGMDLYRDLNKVFYDPSLGVAKLLDQMDLLRRKLAVAAVTFTDPIWVSMVASKLLDGSDAWLSCRGTIKNLQPNELHPSQFRNFLLKEERVLIDARVLGMPQSCDTALFNNNDSGATAHMTCRKEWLFDYTPISHYSLILSLNAVLKKRGALSNLLNQSYNLRQIWQCRFIANRHNNFNKLNRKIVIPIKGTIIKDRQDQSLAVSSTFKSPATISAHRAPFPTTTTTTTTTTTQVNQFLQMDIAEPINVASANYVKQVKSETIIPVKANRSDNGGKFKSRDSDAFLTSKEISRQLATPHIPQQTGTAERKNQNIMNSARSMVIKSAHALRTPALIMKLKLRTMQCIMLGYATGAKAYRLLNPNTSGYVFFLGNSCISWRSSKQTAVALSTAETEYVAATTATQELLFLKTFLTKIGYPINKTTTLYSDSQSAIANTKNIQLRHASNKHTDIKLHFPKDQVKLGNVNLEYINTQDQVADILIKGSSKTRLLQARKSTRFAPSSRRGGVLRY